MQDGLQIALQPHTRLLSALRAVPRAASVGVFTVACLSLAAWVMAPASLADALPSWLRMLPFTACNLMLLGVALWLVSAALPAAPSRPAAALARLASLAVVAFALLTLSEYVFGWGLTADEWLAGRLGGGDESNPERLPLNKALGLLFGSAALLFIDIETRRGARLGQYFALAGLANALLALLGFFYGASSFYKIVNYPGLSLPTSLSFVALSAGALAARPEAGLMRVVTSGSAGGFLARRLLLAALLVPSVMGWLVLMGERFGHYDTGAGVALFAGTTIITFFFVVWRNAAALRDVDAQRQSAEQSLRQANNELERRVAERTAELAATNEGLRREIVERRRVEEERTELLNKEQAARAQAEEFGEMIRRLQAVTDGALAHLKFDDLLGEMLERVRDLLGADSSAILLLADDGRTLSVRASVGLGGGRGGPGEESLSGGQIPVGQGVTGRIAATRAPLVVERLADEEVTIPLLQEKLSSLIGAPLLVEGRLIGVIHAGTVEPRRFSLDDMRLMQLVADRVALAVEQARLFEAEQQARVQAEAANRMKDEFLATVSHELRSPLNAVLGWTTLLREGQLSEEQAARALQTVESAARSQNRIISDLLDVSRIVSGKLRLNVAPLDPARVVAAAVESVAPTAKGRQVTLEKRLDAAAGRILGDADRVQQIVLNLLSNAVKFTPPGGRVTVELKKSGGAGEGATGGEKTGEAPSPRAAASPARHIEIVVSDTGQGIRPEFLPYVFDRFRQADVTSARKHGGLGLGLAIVRNLTEMQGGQVSVTSAGEGQGAAFVVKFPLAEDVLARRREGGGERVTGRGGEVETASPPRPLAPSPAPLAGLRVLVVDDDTHGRELGATVLGQAGAQVRAAASVAEALTVFAQWPPSVLVSDIEMPEADGYELIRRVRAMERPGQPAREGGGRVPAIALTAYARAEDRTRALAAGFELHLAKPFDPAHLVALVSDLASRAGLATSSAR